MIAAMAAMAVFGFLALEATNEAHVALVAAASQALRARLSAEADAGFALAAHGLQINDPAQRWNAAGDLRTTNFNGDLLTIGVENESGKIPLNFILPPEARRMFELAGASAAQADSLTQQFIALRDGGVRDSAHPERARGAPLTAVDQLALLVGMTPALYARLAPEVTVDAPTLRFDPSVARPLALAVMAPDAKAPPSPTAPAVARGHAFTVRVDVQDGRDAELRRSAIIELTGGRSNPVIVRRLD